MFVSLHNKICDHFRWISCQVCFHFRTLHLEQRGGLNNKTVIIIPPRHSAAGYTQTHISSPALLCSLYWDSTAGNLKCNSINHTYRNKPVRNDHPWFLPPFILSLLDLCQPAGDREVSRCDTNSWKMSILIMALCRLQSQ